MYLNHHKLSLRTARKNPSTLKDTEFLFDVSQGWQRRVGLQDSPARRILKQQRADLSPVWIHLRNLLCWFGNGQNLQHQNDSRLTFI